MPDKIKLIAETAWHHEGGFQFMNNLCEELINNSKTDFIKFHLTLDLDEYMDKRYDLYKTLKSWMFSPAQWNEILTRTLNSDKEIMLLFNDQKSIDFGMKFNPKLIEIHSVCLNDLHLLEKLGKNISKDQKIVLGIGGSDLTEIENALEILRHDNIILMFGFQNYPTRYEDVNFNKIRKIKQLYPNFEFGYADHTAWNEENNVLISILGTAIGMNYLEKHVTTNFGIQRCDWQSAITIKTFNEIAEKIKILDSLNGDGLLKLNPGEQKYSVFGPMKKAAILATNMKKGETLRTENIVFKRTSVITDCSQLNVLKMIGFTAVKDLKKNTVILQKHFENRF